MTWKSFADYGCQQATSRWRQLDDGRIEIEGRGVPEMDVWPLGVNQWLPQIMTVSAATGVPAHQIAAIMAIETAGKNVCVTITGSACTGPSCNCVQNEGAGLMATLPSTASLTLGRGVTSQELLARPEVAIEAGAKFFAKLLQRYNGDFVAAAVGYNAGSIKCGRGSTWVPAGSGWPKVPCPGSGWGVVTGCVYSGYAGKGCEPAPPGSPKPNVCSNLYPEKAILANNSAIRVVGTSYPPATDRPSTSRLPLGAVGALALIGASIGWLVLGDYAAAFVQKRSMS